MLCLPSFFVGSFYRAAIPLDVTAGTPNPTLWGIPSAKLMNTKCDIPKFFVNHSIVFGELFGACVVLSKISNLTYQLSLLDITFCGSCVYTYSIPNSMFLPLFLL